MNEAELSSRDIEHLKLLSTFQYVFAGLSALFGCLPVVHLAVGILVLTGQIGEDKSFPAPMQRTMGVLFVSIATFVILFNWGTALAALLTARKLVRHRSHTFCVVVAAIECLFVPYGTVLGVFTLIVLMRPGVKARFDRTG